MLFVPINNKMSAQMVGKKLADPTGPSLSQAEFQTSKEKNERPA